MVLQPRIQTVRVINVPTRHKHTLIPNGYRVTAHGARGRLHLAPILLAVFIFYLDDRKFLNSICFRSLLFGSCLCLFLADSANHFEKVDIIVTPRGLEITIKVGHELIWREP